MKTLSVLFVFSVLTAGAARTYGEEAKLCTAIRFQAMPEPMLFTDTSRYGEAKPLAKDPTVIRHNGRYLMYYSVQGYPTDKAPAGIKPGLWTSAIAESTDLVHWKRIGDLEIKRPVDIYGIVAPCVKKFDGKIHLFGQAPGVPGGQNQIWHATSEDGLRFVCTDTKPAFTPKNNWSINRSIDAEVYRLGNDMILLYASREKPDGKIQRLGMARAPYGSAYDASCWTDLSVEKPLLEPEEPWEMSCLEAGTVIVHRGVHYLLYAGAYNHERQQIGAAYSMDGLHYKRFSKEPVLPHGAPESWNAWESGHPGLFQDDDGQIYLFYQGKKTLKGDYFLSCLKVTFCYD
ncbi:MAG: family 43 glycosylhydrolase [Kiritimatiellae bacterium]|nr:family 43 glycosylhydrolase [Kiritimatiellia bacterium]